MPAGAGAPRQKSRAHADCALTDEHGYVSPPWHRAKRPKEQHAERNRKRRLDSERQRRDSCDRTAGSGLKELGDHAPCDRRQPDPNQDREKKRAHGALTTGCHPASRVPHARSRIVRGKQRCPEPSCASPRSAGRGRSRRTRTDRRVWQTPSRAQRSYREFSRLPTPRKSTRNNNFCHHRFPL